MSNNSSLNDNSSFCFGNYLYISNLMLLRLLLVEVVLERLIEHCEKIVDSASEKKKIINDQEFLFIKYFMDTHWQSSLLSNQNGHEKVRRKNIQFLNQFPTFAHCVHHRRTSSQLL